MNESPIKSQISYPKKIYSHSNTPNLKSINNDSRIKSNIKGINDKPGRHTDNFNRSIQNKEKITSKIIEKYKQQLKAKKANNVSKILVTSLKQNLDLDKNFNLNKKNESLDYNLITDNHSNLLDNRLITKQEEIINKTVSNQTEPKFLNIIPLLTSDVETRFQAKNTFLENNEKRTMIRGLIEKNSIKLSYKKEPLLKINNLNLQIERGKSNPKLIYENNNPQLIKNLNNTHLPIKKRDSKNKSKNNNNYNVRNLQINGILKNTWKKRLDSGDDEYFDYEDEKNAELLNEEKIIYGNREPKGYTKIKLLGKGGCGVVWLGKNSKNELVAIKQLSKKSLKSDVGYYARKELDMFNYLSQIEQNCNVIKLLDYIEDLNDYWLIFEKGGHNFSNLLFKIKGDFHNNERIYCIQKGIFLKFLFEDLNLFKDFFRKMLNFIKFLTINGIVHSDIKPDNILIEFKTTEKNVVIDNLKMIDFGSAFYYKSPDCHNWNTPEYMSPEVNELNEKSVNSSQIVQFMQVLQPWCIDMWSLGVTILEVVLACPLWMSYKTKIKRNHKVFFTTGLFGVKGRNSMKIYQKQIEVAKSLRILLQDCLIRDQDQREKFIDLMHKILDINWKTRISPNEALNHNFFK